MNKIITMLLAFAMALMASVALASASSATSNGGNFEGKKQTICHYTSEHASHQYNKIEVDVNSILNGLPSGHQQHDNGKDVIPPFIYYEKIDGEWVLKSFPGQGSQTLLTYPGDKCEAPVVNEKVAKPESSVNDPCVTKNDTFSVAPGDGYTVASVVENGLVWSITVTLVDGYEWADGTTTPLVLTHTFTNVDCDLPDTGSATTNVVGGLVILALLGGLGFYLLRRRNIV